MSNRRERRHILRKMGLLEESKNKPGNFGSNIEEGKNKHRKHLQNVKNELNKSEKTDSMPNEGASDFFKSINQNNEYSSFKSMLINRNWDMFESDNDGGNT